MHTIGETQGIVVEVTAEDITQFCQLSGDYAPLHTDARFARQMGFEGLIIHGAFLSALVSRLVGMTFPGPDAVLQRMDLAFRQPCYAPCTLRINGVVRQVSEAVHSMVLDISIIDERDRTVVTGKTWHQILEPEDRG